MYFLIWLFILLVAAYIISLFCKSEDFEEYFTLTEADLQKQWITGETEAKEISKIFVKSPEIQQKLNEIEESLKKDRKYFPYISEGSKSKEEIIKEIMINLDIYGCIVSDLTTLRFLADKKINELDIPTVIKSCLNRINVSYSPTLNQTDIDDIETKEDQFLEKKLREKFTKIPEGFLTILYKSIKQYKCFVIRNQIKILIDMGKITTNIAGEYNVKYFSSKCL